MDPSSLWSLQEARTNYSTLLLAAPKENSSPHIQRPIFERTVYRYAIYYQHMNEIEQHFQEAEPGMEKQNLSFNNFAIPLFLHIHLRTFQLCLYHCQRCLIVKVRLLGLQRHCYNLVNVEEGISIFTIRI